MRSKYFRGKGGMERIQVKRTRMLAPLAWLYGVVTACRNRLFDWGWLPSTRFDVPVIGVGNLSVGGTGKTPHTEYLIRLLSPRKRVAVLSRGYKRATRGFLLADERSTSREIGDEPFQMKHKFPDILVAVDADRRRGITRLLDLPKERRPEVILLDDAFQHRYVCPSLQILLTDFHRPCFADALLPDGRLRESSRGIRRADVVVVSKTDEPVDASTVREWREALCLDERQELCFSEIVYGEWTPLYPDEVSPADPAQATVFLVSGIANPWPLLAEARRVAREVIHFPFADHHDFRAAELARIERRRQSIAGPTCLLVTEKDAARLRSHPDLPAAWRPILYQLPIRVRFLGQDGARFNRRVLEEIKNHE